MNPRALLATALALCAAGAGAQSVGGPETIACPPGSTPVTVGSFSAQTCVGSPQPGLVAQTLPYAPANLMGFPPSSGPRLADPVFPTVSERVEVAPAPARPPAIGHLAATDTDMSAPWFISPSSPPKLGADWAFLHDGERLAPGQSMAWMGGVLSRDMAGRMRFKNLLDAPGFDGDVSVFRRDLAGFWNALGPRTQAALADRYDLRPAPEYRP